MLEALRIVKELRGGGQVTKSSIMLGGLGGEERGGEVIKAMRDLRDAGGVDILTIGQYLRPTGGGARHLPVARYVPPNEFQELKELGGLRMGGFRAVAAGPLVRSSYRALELFDS